MNNAIVNALKNLYETDLEKYNNVKRMVSYIYNDLCKDYFERGKKAAVVVNEGEQYYVDLSCKFLDILKSSLKPSLDGNQSILTYLSEMMNDGKEEFINLFFKKVNIYFDILELDPLKESGLNEFSFLLNMYTMLRGYHNYKDNFELFEKIVNDCDFYADNSIKYWFAWDCPGKNLNKVISVINLYIDNEKFCNMSLLRKALEDVMWQWGFNKYNISDIYKIESEKIDELLEIYDLYNQLKQSGKMVSEDAFNKIIAIKFNSLGHKDSSLIINKDLLIANRVLELRSYLSLFKEDENLTNIIRDRILNIDFSLIDKINEEKGDGTDFFSEVITSLRNSDSFFEIGAKLSVLDEAGLWYKNGNYDEAKEKISRVSTVRYKRVLEDGTIIYCDDKVIDKFEDYKPWINYSMINRIKFAYKNAFPSLSIDEIVGAYDEVIYCSNEKPKTLFEYGVIYERNINKYLEEKENKAKQKVKV